MYFTSGIERIETVSIERIKEDVEKFIPGPKALGIWSEKNFLDLITHLKVLPKNLRPGFIFENSICQLPQSLLFENLE